MESYGKVIRRSLPTFKVCLNSTCLRYYCSVSMFLAGIVLFLGTSNSWLTNFYYLLPYLPASLLPVLVDIIAGHWLTNFYFLLLGSR